MHTSRSVRLVLVALITTLSLAFSAEAAIADDATPAQGGEARAILDRASAALADTNTMQFDLEIDGDSWIDPAHTMRLISAKGNLERPDKVDVEFQVNLLGAQNVSIRMITIGEKSWTTDLLTGKWGASPPEFGYNPAVLFDNQKGLGPVAGRLKDPKVEGSEKVGGRDAWRISGTVDKATIDPLTSGVVGGDEVGITLWIDKGNDNILRIEIQEPEIKGKDHPATWTMTLTVTTATSRSRRRTPATDEGQRVVTPAPARVPGHPLRRLHRRDRPDGGGDNPAADDHRPRVNTADIDRYIWVVNAYLIAISSRSALRPAVRHRRHTAGVRRRPGDLRGRFVVVLDVPIRCST